MRPFLLMALLSALGIGCGSPDQNPLGGPYGGTASVPGPLGNTEAAGQQGTGSPSPGGTGTMPTGNPTGGDAGGSVGSPWGAPDSGSSTGNPNPPQDSGTQPPPDSAAPPHDSAPPPPPAPTWTQIFTSYLASGTKGNCNGCHSMSSPSQAYSWLSGRGQVGGSSPALTDSNNSCLSWYGGNMPPGGPSSDSTATQQMNAWAAAGGLDN